MIDFSRLKNKYKKIRMERNSFRSALFIAAFAIRDVLNVILVHLAINKDKNILDVNKRILFIEPTKQGFGDLFFQTSLFKSWKEKGYCVALLTNKKHAQIVENNKSIETTLTWRSSDLLHVLTTQYTIIALGRSTLRETLFCLLNLGSEVVFLDKNIRLFRSIFEENSNTIAWHLISDQCLGIITSQPLPEIFFSNEEKTYISKHKSENKIGIIVGVEKKSKRFAQINKIIAQLVSSKEILLLGKGPFPRVDHKKIHILVNNSSYRENILDIATCRAVIGTEGSLVHIASTLVRKTIVIDKNKLFKQNCHPLLLDNVTIITDRSDEQIVRRVLESVD